MTNLLTDSHDQRAIGILRIATMTAGKFMLGELPTRSVDDRPPNPALDRRITIHQLSSYTLLDGNCFEEYGASAEVIEHLARREAT